MVIYGHGIIIPGAGVAIGGSKAAGAGGGDKAGEWITIIGI